MYIFQDETNACHGVEKLEQLLPIVPTRILISKDTSVYFIRFIFQLKYPYSQMLHLQTLKLFCLLCTVTILILIIPQSDGSSSHCSLLTQVHSCWLKIHIPFRCSPSRNFYHITLCTYLDNTIVSFITFWRNLFHSIHNSQPYFGIILPVGTEESSMLTSKRCPVKESVLRK